MSGAESGSARKQAYFEKLLKLLEEYPKILIVVVDNVGSNHMQKIRQNLRGRAVLLMGKNTMIRKVIRGQSQSNSSFLELLPYIKGNIGFVFTKDDLSSIKKVLVENKVSAAARSGVIAPQDVTIPKGNTGLEPTQTSFFQALNINTKISKGQIEIVNDVLLIKEGQRVGSSEASLLQKLGIRPFSYGLVVNAVYDDGMVYDAKVLDMDDETILASFRDGVRNVAKVSLALGYPTIASLPHALIRGYRNLLAVSVASAYTFRQAESTKKFLEDPSAFAAPAANATASSGKPADEEKPAPAAAVKEESEEDLALGLFD